MLVEDSILVGVVNCSGAHQFGDKSRLAGKAGSGKKQGAVLPPNYAGVQEDAIRCVVGNMNHQVTGEPVQGRLQGSIFRDGLVVNRETKNRRFPAGSVA
jgi:hypothetical protein